MGRFNQLKERFFNLISHDIGIDLGTANTLVYIKGQGVVINEPTVVALNAKTGQIVEVGRGAKEMLGRTPQHIRAVKPLSHGVISDYEITQEFISYLIRRAQEESPSRKIFAPRVVIGSPSGITNVERRAIRTAAKNAGSRVVHVLEEPMLAAIGVRLPVHDPVGSMVVDIGGGTTDIAIISLGGIVHSTHTTVAGDRFTEDIIDYIRDEFKVLIGEQTAEELKQTTASLLPTQGGKRAFIKGRDLITGLPREIEVTDANLREALRYSIELLARQIKQLIEIAPPEIVSDISNRGIVLVGGGALLEGLPEFLEEVLNIPILTSVDPLRAVVAGTGLVLEDIARFADAFVHDDEIPINR